MKTTQKILVITVLIFTFLLIGCEKNDQVCYECEKTLEGVLLDSWIDCDMNPTKALGVSINPEDDTYISYDLTTGQKTTCVLKSHSRAL